MKAIKIFCISVAIFVIALISGCTDTMISYKLKQDLLSDTNTIIRIHKIMTEKGIIIRDIYVSEYGLCYLILEYDVLRYNQLKQDLKESSK